MKKILFLLALVCLSHSAHAQLFAREKLTNLENFDKQRWSWGYYFGLNKYDFKFVYDETKTKDVYTNRSTGFNVGLVGDLRLNDPGFEGEDPEHPTCPIELFCHSRKVDHTP